MTCFFGLAIHRRERVHKLHELRPPSLPAHRHDALAHQPCIRRHHICLPVETCQWPSLVSRRGRFVAVPVVWDSGNGTLLVRKIFITVTASLLLHGPAYDSCELPHLFLAFTSTSPALQGSSPPPHAHSGSVRQLRTAVVVLGVHLNVVPLHKDLHHRLMPISGSVQQRHTAMPFLGIHLKVVPCHKNLHH